MESNALSELYEQHQANARLILPTSTAEVNFVPGYGVFKHYMFIAEAPGATENEQKIPLVGQAGQLFRQILEEIEFPTERFYTNIWKFRPPNNRAPNSEEIKLGRGCVAREIQIVSPRTIILLGRTAARALFPRPLMRGKLYNPTEFHPDFDRPRIIATYHPGYLLDYRHPECIDECKQHLKKAILEKGG